ncbi:Uncharacterised protein [Bordetella pertussis]|nr:Uncharacterised protein [Bordetella pertussis]
MTAGFQASPPTSDDNAYSHSAPMNMRRWPSRSTARPPSSRKPPQNTV